MCDRRSILLLLGYLSITSGSVVLASYSLNLLAAFVLAMIVGIIGWIAKEPLPPTPQSSTTQD